MRIDPPPDASRINQISIDLCLGRKFTTFRNPPDYITSVRVKPSIFKSKDLWEHSVNADNFELGPGGFVLAQTFERVTLPNDLFRFVEGRSSWARIGVSIHLTAPKIDPGFKGTITLEISNTGKAKVNLVAEEDTPAQIMFLRLTTPLPVTGIYGTRAGDIFQYQTNPIPHGQAQ